MSRHSGLFSYFLLTLAGGLSRLLFVRPTPINWDGVQFALALGHFDLHYHQPHPPGYILYVLLGRALLPLWPDPAVALSMLSVLFSAAAAPLVYWLGKQVLEDERAGLAASLLWLGSPLALYYGSVGLTYIPEAVLGMAVAAVAWRVRERPTLASAAALGVVLGIVGGVRQTSVLVLLPLCLWALWGRQEGYRKWLTFALGFIATCALWLVPLLTLSGGLESYFWENALLASAVSERTSALGAGAEGVAYNLTFEALGLALGLCFGLVPLGLWAARVIRFSLSRTLRLFLLWWTLPALLFYMVSHVGQYGYLLVVLPPVLLLSGACIVVAATQLSPALREFAALIVGATDAKSPFGDWPLARVGGFCLDVARIFRKRVGHRDQVFRQSVKELMVITSISALSVAFSAALALGSTAYFVAGSGPITASSVVANDAHASALGQALAKMDLASTVLVTGVAWEKPFRLAGYMLPALHTYAVGPDLDGTLGWLFSAYGGQSTYHLPHPVAQARLVLPPGTCHVLALDNETAQMMGGEKKLRAVSLADGSTLYMLDSSGPTILALVIRNGEILRDDSVR